jgi:hypothetical protein
MPSGRRHSRRAEHAIPGGDVVTRQHAGLDRGRHVRHGGKPILAGDGKRLECAGLHLAKQRRDSIEQDIGMMAARDLGRPAPLPSKPTIQGGCNLSGRKDKTAPRHLSA